jgi:surface antigen
VESVNANGTINISEMNFEGLGKKSFRTIDGDSVAGYIYPKE